MPNWFTETFFGGMGGLPVPMSTNTQRALSTPTQQDAVIAEMYKQLTATTMDRRHESTLIADREPDEYTSEQVRNLARRTPEVVMWVNLRVRQSVRVGRRSRSRDQVGYVIQRRDGKEMTSRDNKHVEQLYAMLELGQSMSRKMGMMARDVFEIDRGISQFAFNARGLPMLWQVQDGSTFRYGAATAQELRDGRWDPNRPMIQWSDGMPETGGKGQELTFAAQELLIVQLNERTDRLCRGYGYPCTVMAIDAINDLINSGRYQSNLWENGTLAGNLVKFYGDAFTDEQIANIKRMWVENTKGVANAHRLFAVFLRKGVKGVTESDDVKIENMAGGTPRDLEFRWARGLWTRVWAAIAGFDLNEVGMDDPADTGKSGLSEADQSWRQLAGREQGFQPWLSRFSEEMETKGFSPYENDRAKQGVSDYVLTFRGLDALTPEKQADLDQKLGQYLMPMNQVRAIAGEKPIKWTYENPEDECPLAYLPLYLPGYQAHLQQKMGMQGGAPGQDPNAPPQGEQQPPPEDDTPRLRNDEPPGVDDNGDEWDYQPERFQQQEPARLPAPKGRQ